MGKLFYLTPLTGWFGRCGDKALISSNAGWKRPPPQAIEKIDKAHLYSEGVWRGLLFLMR